MMTHSILYTKAMALYSKSGPWMAITMGFLTSQCHLQATEGSLRRTRSVRQPRSASKRSALVLYIKMLGFFCVCLSELIEELGSRRGVKICM